MQARWAVLNVGCFIQSSRGFQRVQEPGQRVTGIRWRKREKERSFCFWSHQVPDIGRCWSCKIDRPNGRWGSSLAPAPESAVSAAVREPSKPLN